MSEPESLTVQILRDIRDDIRGVRAEVHATNERLDVTNEQVGLVETTLRDLAEQQRFVVRHLSALTSRDRKLETEVDDLKGRVDAIEKRLPGWSAVEAGSVDADLVGVAGEA